MSVSGRAIQRPILKIEKNVKTTEIDHNGAFLCVREYTELVIFHIPTSFVQFNCQKVQLKISSEKWCFVLFCFVPVGRFDVICHFDDNHNEIGHFDEIPNSSVTSIRPNFLILIYSLGDSNFEQVSVALLTELLSFIDFNYIYFTSDG